MKMSKQLYGKNEPSLKNEIVKIVINQQQPQIIWKLLMTSDTE